MTRKNLIKSLANKILSVKKTTPVFIGINGVDGSGKTYLTNELKNELRNCGREIITASIDHFHNSREIRYAKGENSAEGYYHDSFNLKILKDVLLNPLSEGNLEYKTKTFDYKSDSEIFQANSTASNNSILLMEGIFLFRKELVNYWDLKIFLDVDFKHTVPRAVERDKVKKESKEEQELVDEKYRLRYIPGQKMYLKEAQPRECADIVIDNSDFDEPRLNI